MHVTSRFPMALSSPRSFVKYHFERQAGRIQASWQSLTQTEKGVQGHAVAEVAETLTIVQYIVRASSSIFLLHQPINHTYHIFHQVMSSDSRAYSLKKRLLYSYDR